MQRTYLTLAWTIGFALVAAIGGCGGAALTNGAAGDLSDVVFAEDGEVAIAVLPFVEDELLVQPFPGADPAALAQIYADAGATLIGGSPEIDLAVLSIAAADMKSVAQALGESGLIETVQKDYLFEAAAVPNDPLFFGQAHLTQVQATKAWDTTVGHAGVVVAVVDTGVDPTHPDLSDRIREGWNIYDENSSFADTVGHGTMVAGVLAASSDNAQGVAGVTWDSPLLVVRVSDSAGLASSRHIAAGILWAAGHGAKVINVSFAPLWSNRIVRAAAQSAFNRGSLVVISAGNGGGTTGSRGYPEILYSGAVETDNSVAFFSDQGPFVDLSAPGTAISTTTRGGGYDLTNGTSFAAPIITGVAALAWSVNPDLRPISIINLLTGSAVDLGASGKDNAFGHGMVDAAAAVDAALQLEASPDETPPTVSFTRPADNSTATRRFRVTATASDESGVADVQLLIDGQPHAVDTRSPYRFVVDPASFPSGLHDLQVVATDAVGNSSQPATITVRFQVATSSGGSAGRITFVTPSSGTTVSGSVTIQATVRDNDGAATVEWLVDGRSVVVSAVSGSVAGTNFLWRTGSYESGRHTITVVLTDSLGGRTTADLDLVVQ